MAQQILFDNRLDTALLKEGYVVVPFLKTEEVKSLTDFFNQHHPQGINGFYATAHAPDIAFRKLMNDAIKKIFSTAIEQYFQNCIPLGGSFVVKSNAQKERLHPHQDWNIVDEEKFRSFNIWVPLVNLNEHNGIIKVLPRSHRWAKSYRGPNIPDPFQNHLEWIWRKMIPLFMKAGEALIYDHRLFHASEPNTTNQLRLAAVFGIKPAEAQMYYYFGNNGKIDMYNSSVDFFMEGNIQRGPELLTLYKNNLDNLPQVSFLKLLSVFYKNRLGIWM